MSLPYSCCVIKWCSEAKKLYRCFNKAAAFIRWQCKVSGDNWMANCMQCNCLIMSRREEVCLQPNLVNLSFGTNILSHHPVTDALFSGKRNVHGSSLYFRPLDLKGPNTNPLWGVKYIWSWQIKLSSLLPSSELSSFLFLSFSFLPRFLPHPFFFSLFLILY